MAISENADIALALWYSGPGQVDIRQEAIVAPKSDEVRVRALYSAISRGTEALVLGGRVPESEFDRMRAPFMAGQFPYPVKYGYAAVGRVESGADALRGKTVFSLHPHQSAFNIPASAAIEVPASVPPLRAVLAANMETALNAVWDAAPGRPTALPLSVLASWARWSRISAGNFQARTSRSSTSIRPGWN